MGIDCVTFSKTVGTHGWPLASIDVFRTAENVEPIIEFRNAKR